MNIYGRTGRPIGEYRSMREYWKARREAKLQDVASQIAQIEVGEKRKDEHFEAWIQEECITKDERVAIETDTRILRQSYEAYCRVHQVRPYTRQAWGRWMSAHYLRVTRNAGGVLRVYIGIAVKPEEFKGVNHGE